MLSDRPTERTLAAYIRAFNAHDIDATLRFFADGWTGTDRRALAWEELHGREDAAALLRSGWSGSADMRVDVEEVLACDDHVIAVCVNHHGTFDMGGGEYEYPLAWVLTLDGEVFDSLTLLDPDDRQAIIARYLELGGGNR